MPIIQDWVTFEIFVLFCVPVLWSCESKLYYAYIISGMALSEQKLDDWAGEWLSFSATLPFLPFPVKMADNVDKTDR